MSYGQSTLVILADKAWIKTMAETTHFTSNGKSIDGDLFEPGGTPKGGLIVIAHGTDGLLDPWGEQILGYGKALAEAGFIALVPHYFKGTETPPGVQAAQTIGRLRDTWQQTLADAVAHAAGLPGANSSRVGLLGFSLGGHLCLRLRAMVTVLVEFFGPALDLGPANPNRLLAQVHYGLSDELVPPDQNLPTILETLKNEHATCESHTYRGAKHGFIGDDPANAKAREVSRKLTLQFFADHL